ASDRHLRPGGTIAGPTMMALADCVVWLAIIATLGRGEAAVTTNLNINFMRRPEPADLIAEARLLKLGRRSAVGDVMIYSDDGGDAADHPVAHATLTYAIPGDDQADT
ncbi:MAG: PaaI family thioesterase, partial [Alphaproteobacteria bacterium]|nr:PaaI family thioesterase [Alphaproteobacteria bacterium]